MKSSIVLCMLSFLLVGETVSQTTKFRSGIFLHHSTATAYRRHDQDEDRNTRKEYGIPTATETGIPLDIRVLDTINKYLPEGAEKYKSLDEVEDIEIVKKAFAERAKVKAGEVAE